MKSTIISLPVVFAISTKILFQAPVSNGGVAHQSTQAAGLALPRAEPSFSGWLVRCIVADLRDKRVLSQDKINYSSRNMKNSCHNNSAPPPTPIS